MRKFYSLLLVSVLALSLFLSACSKDKNALKLLGEDEQVKLKVVCFDENYFYQQYANYFSMKYPNVEFEVISTNKMQQELEESKNPDSNEAYTKFIEKNQPDVLMLYANQFEKFASAGKLYELDTMIKQEKFDMDSIIPNVIQLLKDKGGGKIYGLAPTFSAQAIYYNIDMFQKYGVDLPKNQMTWEEVLQLAKRFPTGGSEKDREYGLYMDYGMTPSNFIMMVANTENLRLVDKEEEKVQFDAEQWRKVYQLVVDGFQSKTLVNRDMNMQGGTMESYYQGKTFLMGKTAMAIGGTWLTNEMQRVKDDLKDYKPFQWGVVTAPVSAMDPNTADSMYLDEIIAINAQSPNTRAAWEFVKFVNGPEMAKMQSRQLSGSLPTRKEFIKDKENHDLSAFYMLTPRAKNVTYRFEKTPESFFQTILQVMDEQTKQVLDNTQSADQAITNIQKQLQEGLIKAKQEEKAAKEKEQAKK
ncbi:hypothetical protein BVG16_14115 [Paenibacillus selenitireducens]|uniref:ABC transporter substrate-binding protein n=1 Tax=Paenibacillus selenitireducens TaxID=1324314 RepID=A0A1T2XCM4_9BACL|nr:extracellular solute-binding protein [Paenibacillus selenitireducens]OPA77578.1 hypothetical protein BVG16_14115 [Paenibacillus selenitireducens]